MILPHPEIAGGHGHEELAPPRLLLERFLRTLAKQRQLHLAHRALHAEQQAIVGVAGIVEAILIDDQGADKTAELQQGMPIPAVARQPRSFVGDDCPHPSIADGGEQSLEARAGDTGAGAAEIVVDYLDAGPAQRTSAIGEPVLTAPALVIVENLVGRRLPNVDESRAREVFSRDLAHRRPPR